MLDGKMKSFLMKIKEGEGEEEMEIYYEPNLNGALLKKKMK